MIATVLKGDFIKRGPKTIKYRDNSKFITSHFRTALKIAIAEKNGQLHSVVKKALDNHAPIKRKNIRANNEPL